MNQTYYSSHHHHYVGIFKFKDVIYVIGRRSCLGEVLARQELMQFISGLVQNFTILPDEDNQHIDDTGITGLIYKPKHFKVRMIPRSK